MLTKNAEILELAVKIEREGKRFYYELSKNVDDPKVQEFLVLMEKEEAAHEIHFKNMLETKEDLGWEDDEDLKKLVQDKFQTDIFPSLDKIIAELPRFEGIEKAFNFAIEAEKVAAEFYRMLGDACTDFEIKTHLALLEKAEREHCNVVETLKTRVLQGLSQ